MRRLALIAALILAIVLISGPAAAQVNGVAFDATKGVVLLASPAGVANCKAATTGAIRYNSTTPAIEFCNGTAWAALYQVQSSPAITAPAGSGYLVLSHNTYNGNLGGLSGADAKCLTDLTTNTGWQGYSTANSNGQLVSSKVHAFMCQSSGGVCNNLTPLAKYYFANAMAGQGAAGGAYLTTDSSGLGPNDSNPWSAANYFNGSYISWSDRNYNSNSLWDNSYYGNDCSVWTSSSSGVGGRGADSSATGLNRWLTSADITCDQTEHLMCNVNP